MSEVSVHKFAMDWRLSFAVILTLLIQTAAALLWAGGAGERLAQLERHDAVYGSISERTARLEAQNAYIRTSLTRIESKLDAAIARDANLSDGD